MGSKKLQLCFLFFSALLILNQQKTMSLAFVTGNILTNEVMESASDETHDLPLCRGVSACGFLQVNAFGINKVQFCQCPSLSTVCPVHWDPEDGHSITMGSQQFKYCGKAPSLHTCKRGEPAYLYATLLNPKTYDILGVKNILHCFCPSPTTHVSFKEIFEDKDDVMVTGSLSSCDMLPICDFEQPCKEVSLSPSANLVETKCKCRRGLICPSLSSKAVINENNYFNHGQTFSIYCQHWY